MTTPLPCRTGVMAKNEDSLAAPRVVIIGAGMAGISAAHRLLGEGIRNVTILEALSRYGGRIHTMSLGSSVLELGAYRIHGGCLANPLFTLANQHQLLGQKVVRSEKDPGYFYTSDGRAIDEQIGRRGYELFLEVEEMAEKLYLDDSQPKQSLCEFIDAVFETKLCDCPESERGDLERVLYGMTNYLRLYSCDDLDLVQANLYGSSLELPGGDVKIPGGFRTILDVLVKDLPPECIILNTVVEKVIRSYEGGSLFVKVYCKNGKTYLADYVIVTIPLGVLKHSYSTFFVPELPAHKIEAINRIGSGRLCKLYFEFERPFWAQGEGGVILAWSREELQNKRLPEEWYKGIFSFDEVDDNPRILLCWVVGSEAEVVETVSDQDVIFTCMCILRKFTGDPTLPDPVHLVRTNWCSGPYSRGAYTYPTMATTSDDFHALSEPIPNIGIPQILFAGEATHNRYYSFVHGARLSGIREADRIALFYKIPERTLP